MKTFVILAILCAVANLGCSGPNLRKYGAERSSTNEDTLRQYLEQFGSVANVEVPLDGDTGRWRGFSSQRSTCTTGYNPLYEDIGKSFTQQYYELFDNKVVRPNLRELYHPTDSLMTFEGPQYLGAEKIMEKFNVLPYQNVQRVIKSVDYQPMLDCGVLINVLGELTTDHKAPRSFSQTFVLKKSDEGVFYCQHDIYGHFHNTVNWSLNR